MPGHQNREHYKAIIDMEAIKMLITDLKNTTEYN